MAVAHHPMLVQWGALSPAGVMGAGTVVPSISQVEKRAQRATCLSE